MIFKQALVLVNNTVKNINKISCRTRANSSSSLSYFHHVGKTPLSHLTVGGVLEKAAKNFYGHPAIISRHQKKSITYNELLEQANKLAAGLYNIGLKFGDRVGILAPNMIEWEVVLLACARAGFILVQLNPAYQAQELEYCINKVQIKCIISAHKFKSQNYHSMLSSIHSNLGKGGCEKIPSLKNAIIISNEKLEGTHCYYDILKKADANAIKSIEKYHSDVQMDHGCNIQFTSGTTGKPKATLLSHFNCVNNSFFIGLRNELHSGSNKICIQVPYFHTFGTTVAILGSLHFGATQVLPGLAYNPSESLDAIVEEKCNMIYGTPTMYVDLVNVQRERKEVVKIDRTLVGGAPCSPSLFADMIKYLNVAKINSIYGLTETTCVAFQCTATDSNLKAINTLGKVGEHLEVKIIDDFGKMVPFGTPGELCVRGYNIMLEYWGDREKTDEILMQDKWLKTGDVFVLYEDGYGQIVGRNKDMIIRGGENIFPKEVEDFLNTHPDIIESQVVGIPNERLGEEVGACLRISKNSTLSHASLVQFCKGQIAHFKIPSKMKIMTEFPKTSSGKIQKYKLKDLFKL